MDQHARSGRADSYDALRRRFGRIASLGEASAVLMWDCSSMMPPGGAVARGEQMATLAGLAHEMLVSAETGDLLGEASIEAGRDGVPDAAWDARNLALMRRAFRRASALPGELVEARTRAETACEQIWRGARADDDFARVAAPLGDLLALVRTQSRLLGDALGMSPYDALMDGFQPGVTAATADAAFARYETFLRTALPAAERRERSLPPPLELPKPVAETTQEEMCRELSASAGLDYDHARLDRSLHPFCGGTPDDVRITTRYDVDNPSRALMGVLHETGHALYERGLPARWRRQPVGEAAGMAVHESQSLIVEMQACRSDAYLGWLAPRLAARYGGASAAYRPANLARLWRRVERSLIRVDADELTYPAHVIARFRLEQLMIDGSLAVADLPDAWNDAYDALLGIRPPDDRTGCLQDIHWYAGLFGYFPAYSLGAMAAAQLMRRCRAAVPDLDAALGRGDLAPLLAWLREQIHGRGQRHGFDELLREATGSALDPTHFIAHLEDRYGLAGHDAG